MVSVARQSVNIVGIVSVNTGVNNGIVEHANTTEHKLPWPPSLTQDKEVSACILFWIWHYSFI